MHREMISQRCKLYSIAESKTIFIYIAIIIYIDAHPIYFRTSVSFFLNVIFLIDLILQCMKVML